MNNVFVRLCAFGLLLTLCVPGVHASPQVRYKATATGSWDALPAGVGSMIVGENITVSGAVAGFYRVFTTDPSDDDLGLVEFINSSAAITVLIADSTASDINIGFPLSAGCRDLGGFDPGNCQVTLQARIAGNLLENAEVRANRIVRLDVDGTMNKPRILHDSATETLSAIRVGGQIADNLNANPIVSEIRSRGGRIALVQANVNASATRGPLAVRIRVVDANENATGDIGRIDANGYDVGGARLSASQPPFYQGTEIKARTIDAIFGDTIRSNIIATVGVRHVESSVGSIRGNLNAPTLLPRGTGLGGLIKAKGACDMNMIFTDELPADGKIEVGTFYGYACDEIGQATIQLPAGGLKGQIVFNSRLAQFPVTSSCAGGTVRVEEPFTGLVKVGTTTISEPNYPHTAAPLGGGCVAVAPYKLHLNDSAPAYEQVARYDGPLESDFTTTGVPVIMCSYGPVRLASGITDPNNAVRIDCRSETDPCSWHEGVGAMFDVVLHPEIVTPTQARIRSIGLRRRGDSPPKAGIYRVVPIGLDCDGLDMSAPSASGARSVAWLADCDSEPAYIFRVGPDCPDGGELDENDLLEIDQSRNPMTGISPLDINNNDSIDACDATDECACDWNDNCAVSVQDIFDFLSDYFAGNGDFNANGMSSVQDIFDFLTCYFQAPPAC